MCMRRTPFGKGPLHCASLRWGNMAGKLDSVKFLQNCYRAEVYCYLNDVMFCLICSKM